ncbi:hypothetical protein [Mariprofundus ferrooxydans]|uniref:hypothetical protein n=1 Tax=Mariprofundus ferrooxydans TaxID=314344 RepID=UPI0012DD2EFC|nr:hypothetical protein [Mariprofundus ferrooxydans]
MTRLNRYCRMTLPVLLLSMSGCADIQQAFDPGRSGLLSAFSKEAASGHDIRSRLLHADQASDREAARNALIREFISTSDQSCNKVLAGIPGQVKKWELKSRHTDNLDKILADGIGQRQFDSVNPALTLNRPGEADHSKQLLAESIISTIRHNRERTLVEIQAHEEMNIHRYSLKQALQNVQAYHSACAVEAGIAGVARSTMRRMTPAEKQAEIESLMQLRQTLIRQGVSTRAVQKKIDAVIMAD